MRRGRGALAWSAALALGWLLGATPPLDAYQIKRVVRGSATLAAATEVMTTDLTSLLGSPLDPLDLTRSFLFFNVSENAGTNTRTDTDVRGLLDDDRTILWARQTSTVALNAEYMVVEFLSGGTYPVTVISGTTTMADAGGISLTKNITLPQSVSLSKSFPLISWKSQTSAAAQDERNLFTATLTDSTHLRLQRLETTNGYNTEIAYQVVAFDTNDPDVTVQGNTTTITTATSATAAIATVDPNKSLLFMTVRANNTGINGVEENYMVDGRITSSTQITFNKFGTTNGVIVQWNVVEFKNNAYGQNNRLTTFSTAATGIPVSSTDLNRSLAVISASGSAAASTSGLDELLVRGQLTTTTNLQVTREPSGTIPTTNVSWATMELPLLNVTSPDLGTEVWKVGEIKNVAWQHAKDLETSGTCSSGAGPGHKLKLELCKDGATCAAPLTITADVCANLDTYPWTIPDTLNPGAVSVIGTTNRVKITDVDYTATTRNFDVSNNNFEIKGTTTVTVPNGPSDVWAVGENRNITWNKTGDLSYSTFEIHLSEDGGGSYPTPVATGLTQASYCTSGTCSYPWNPVADKIGTKRRIRVRLASDPANVVDTSNADFVIKRSLTITAHNGGSPTLESKKCYTLRWDYKGQTGFGTVMLEDTPDNGLTWYPVQDADNPGASALAANNNTVCSGDTADTDTPPFGGKGHYPWMVPDSAISTGGQARVRVTSNSDPSVQDESNSNFTIIPSIRVDTPNAGSATHFVDTTRTVTWTCSPPVMNVKLELLHSATGSNPWTSTLITNSTPAKNVDTTHGDYASWSVSDAVGSYNKVRITGLDAGGAALSPAVTDDSDLFVIMISGVSGLQTALHAIHVAFVREG